MNDRFLRALAAEPVDRTPVWIMRQAGRYLPEYRALKERHGFWELCTVPELTVEVTLQPIDRLGLDAAILFSDILVPLAAMGLEVEFRPGPVLPDPIRAASDLSRLGETEGCALYGRVAEAIGLLRRELDGKVPLIGFAGAPFTLATYAVEGGGSKSFSAIRALLFGDPATAHRLLERIAVAVLASLRAQIEAGVQAVQLFDSWAGLLGPDDYDRFARPYAERILGAIGDAGIPRIYFAPGASSCLERMRTLPVEAIGIDWRIPLGEARRRLEDRTVVQGNLDPGVLLGSREGIEERTAGILREARGAKGHVMNLGHGILPETPVENALAFVETVHRLSGQGGEQ
ncbi:MAG: uroporphyrinogen decarboxylase [Candidatus Eisenbacteria bacterium]|nr:uroporphyrinogen decarboxylase [Candidatus Latescibacterota bacterium]MBD3302907.1 uroporphyrinogen decarboxylase [Candidatus Eisenbacteria bacterium]